MKTIAYTFRAWMRKFRPDGLGHIVVGGFSVGQCGEPLPKDATDITFTEVICDYCNAEIRPMDADGKESTVYVQGSNSICSDCAHKSKD